LMNALPVPVVAMVTPLPIVGLQLAGNVQVAPLAAVSVVDARLVMPPIPRMPPVLSSVMMLGSPPLLVPMAPARSISPPLVGRTLVA
jgi:hypothetical protein